MLTWREIQKENFTSWEVLARFLNLDPSQCQRLIKKHSFVLNLPLRLAKKIQKGTLDDPILRQFVPLHEEGEIPTLFEKDVVKDASFCLSKKLLQKYEGRALLLASGACAMHCRYCFRQHFPYESKRKDFEEEILLVEQDSSIKELILSGGDPLSLSNSRLSTLFSRLEHISHLRRLRFHTRFPIGIPERIDEEFLNLLASSTLQIWFIIHCNHPVELDDMVLASLKKVQCLGIPVLNQAVLLKGVNDSVETLQALFEKLVDHGIQPYYLHQLDKVDGAHSFEVPEEEGKKMMQTLRERLSGYALPIYAKEIPGEKSKTPL